MSYVLMKGGKYLTMGWVFGLPDTPQWSSDPLRAARYENEKDARRNMRQEGLEDVVEIVEE